MVSGRIQRDLTLQQFKEQKEREVVAYARKITEARRDRLIKRYEEVVLAARRFMDRVYDVQQNGEWEDSKGRLHAPPPIDVLLEYEIKERDEFRKTYTLLANEVDNKDIIELCEEFANEHADLVEPYDKLVAAVRTHIQELERAV